MLTLSREYYFRYREYSGRRCSLEAAFEKKAGLWLRYINCKTCIRIINFNICCIKSDVMTLELL